MEITDDGRTSPDFGIPEEPVVFMQSPAIVSPRPSDRTDTLIVEAAMSSAAPPPWSQSRRAPDKSNSQAWTIEDVIAWTSTLPFLPHGVIDEVIQEERITGKVLLTLTKQDIQSLYPQGSTWHHQFHDSIVSLRAHANYLPESSLNETTVAQCPMALKHCSRTEEAEPIKAGPLPIVTNSKVNAVRESMATAPQQSGDIAHIWHVIEQQQAQIDVMRDDCSAVRSSLETISGLLTPRGTCCDQLPGETGSTGHSGVAQLSNTSLGYQLPAIPKLPHSPGVGNQLSDSSFGSPQLSANSKLSNSPRGGKHKNDSVAWAAARSAGRWAISKSRKQATSDSSLQNSGASWSGGRWNTSNTQEPESSGLMFHVQSCVDALQNDFRRLCNDVQAVQAHLDDSQMALTGNETHSDSKSALSKSSQEMKTTRHNTIKQGRCFNTSLGDELDQKQVVMQHISGRRVGSDFDNSLQTIGSSSGASNSFLLPSTSPAGSPQSSRMKGSSSNHEGLTLSRTSSRISSDSDYRNKWPSQNLLHETLSMRGRGPSSYADSEQRSRAASSYAESEARSAAPSSTGAGLLLCNPLRELDMLCLSRSESIDFSPKSRAASQASEPPDALQRRGQAVRTRSRSSSSSPDAIKRRSQAVRTRSRSSSSAISLPRSNSSSPSLEQKLIWQNEMSGTGTENTLVERVGALRRASSHGILPVSNFSWSSRDQRSSERSEVSNAQASTDGGWTQQGCGMIKKDVTQDATRMNGTYFVIGGFDGHDALSSAEVFDPSMGRVGALPNLDRGLIGHSAVTLGRFVYVMGGFDGLERQITSQRLDTAVGVWEMISPMQHRRAASVAVAVTTHGRVCCLGGEDGNEVLNSCEILDSQGWSFLSSMATPRAAAAGTVVMGTIFVVGGDDGNGILSSGEFLEMDHGKGWQPLPPMRHARVGAVATASPQRIYAIGGRDIGGVLSSVESLDLSKEATWEILAPMSCPRFLAAGIASSSGWVLVLGGSDENGDALDSTECFDPSLGIWSWQANLGCRRSGAVAVCSTSIF